MISLTVGPENSGTSLYGKSVSDLQSGISISDGVISGTLHPVTEYDGFSNTASYQSGTYIALNVDADADVTVKLVGGSAKSVKVDGSTAVVRVTNPNTQSIQVTAKKDDEEVTETYKLSGLTLES